jgi:hypothetical protein
MVLSYWLLELGTKNIELSKGRANLQVCKSFKSLRSALAVANAPGRRQFQSPTNAHPGKMVPKDLTHTVA